MSRLSYTSSLLRLFSVLLWCVHSAGAWALDPGDHDVRLRVGGLDRHYVIHVPQKAPPRPALILNFHGAGANAREQQKYSRMDLLAAREGFLVVYPDGTGPIRDR